MSWNHTSYDVWPFIRISTNSVLFVQFQHKLRDVYQLFLLHNRTIFHTVTTTTIISPIFRRNALGVDDVQLDGSGRFRDEALSDKYQKIHPQTYYDRG